MASIKQEKSTGNVEGGELNTKMSTRRVWLVKVPTFLAEAWYAAIYILCSIIITALGPSLKIKTKNLVL